MASPEFTDVFAALAAVVNTKFPEIIALELLTVLLNNPTVDSVEVAVGFAKETGSMLQDLEPRAFGAVFDTFRAVLHEGEIDKRVQFLIEGLFAVRKAQFKGYPAVRPELDLAEQEDQIAHDISILEDQPLDPETSLDIFKPDPNYAENEKRYEDLKMNILGEEGSDNDTDDDDDDESEEENEEMMRIKDETETNLINLRRTIYSTIMSSLQFEDAGHKLMEIKLEPGQEMELCIMLLDCCSHERTYHRHYGLLGQRLCMMSRIHQENFEKCFVQQYSMIHRLETNMLRNVAKLFAYLLGTDALPWHVLSYIRLTEDDTTSSSRIFIKILFQELSEQLGIRNLKDRLSDPAMQDSFESVFPRDNPKNTRFSINFFTAIGLGGITDNLREYLKNMPQQQQKPASDSDSESDSSDSSDSRRSKRKKNKRDDGDRKRSSKKSRRD
ncbi:Pre-mRNA-splicing factor CWC22 homolog [Linum grandiflorum]